MRGVERRFPYDRLKFLRQVADAQARPLSNRALIGRFLAQNHLKEGGLARSVRADEADAGVRAQVCRSAIE